MSGSWRMANATLQEHGTPPVPDVYTAEQLLAEVQRLWLKLQTLPCRDRPNSLAYIALEARIRWYADRYRTVTRRGPS